MQAVLSTAVVNRSLTKSTIESYFLRTGSIWSNYTWAHGLVGSISTPAGERDWQFNCQQRGLTKCSVGLGFHIRFFCNCEIKTIAMIHPIMPQYAVGALPPSLPLQSSCRLETGQEGPGLKLSSSVRSGHSERRWYIRLMPARDLTKSTLENYFRHIWSIWSPIWDSLEPMDLLRVDLLSCRKRLAIQRWTEEFN